MGHKEEYDLFEGDRLQSLNPSNEEEDMVNHPSHYISESGLEVIDVIEAFTTGLDGGEAFCIGNALKYLCRWKNKENKDVTEDLRKAIWYIQRVIDKQE